MPSSPLPRATPESQGVSSSELLGLIDFFERDARELHSIMVLRHGKVIAEGWWNPYRADTPHNLHSLSKSFTSTAVGFAIAEGLLSLDDPVLSFFPDQAPANPGENLKAMRVRHLLSMTTGHATELPGSRFLGDADGISGFLQCPVEHPPGAHFVYNSGASFMLAAIVQQVTGQRQLDYLTRKLFHPLGITDANWEICTGGIDCGGWGLKLKTEDIARFGQFCLQKGAWGGAQILPESWIEEATSLQAPTEEVTGWRRKYGYGFQFWLWRRDAYLGSGAFGQFCLVLPNQDTVVTVTAAVDDSWAMLNVFGDYLLPVLGPVPLPADPGVEEALRLKLASLALRVPDGAPGSPFARKFSGCTYVLETNPQGYKSIGFDFAADFCRIRLQTARGEHCLPCRMNGDWQRTTTRFQGAEPSTVAISGAWTSPFTFAFRLCSVETAYCPTILCHFEGRRIRLEYQPNVHLQSDPYPEIFGRRE